MFKRIFSLIVTIFFLCFKCLTWVPTAAATGIPAFDAFYYAILQSLGMAYTNGIEMDLAPAITEVRENIPDYLTQPDVALKYLLREYASKAWDNLIIQWNDSADEDITMANISAIRLATDEVSTPTLKDIVSQYQKKALNTDYNITTPINTQAITFWNKYNSLYINDYLDIINATPAGYVEPTPNIDFVDDINVINGKINSHNGFWFYNYPTIGYEGFNSNFGTCTSFFAPFENYSFISESSLTQSYNGGSRFTGNLFPFSIFDVNITSNNGVYSFSITKDLNIAYSSSQGAMNYNKGILFGYPDRSYSGQTGFQAYYGDSISISYSGSLQGCFDQLKARFKNINIYVDGVLWANARDNYIVPFEVTAPNSVIDNSTDDGKIVSNPIYWAVDENTGTPIDSQINLDKLIDYLKGIIDGSNYDTSVDFGDLVDAGIIEKQDGSAITDENVITVPVADAIDDALANSDTIDTPIAAIEDLPPLPPLPPFFPTPDFPEGDPTSGFHGMSVLARIINITNQSLPFEVVIVFYGVVFGAVILGLIKILHK